MGLEQPSPQEFSKYLAKEPKRQSPEERQESIDKLKNTEEAENIFDIIGKHEKSFTPPTPEELNSTFKEFKTKEQYSDLRRVLGFKNSGEDHGPVYNLERTILLNKPAYKEMLTTFAKAGGDILSPFDLAQIAQETQDPTMMEIITQQIEKESSSGYAMNMFIERPAIAELIQATKDENGEKLEYGKRASQFSKLASERIKKTSEELNNIISPFYSEKEIPITELANHRDETMALIRGNLLAKETVKKIGLAAKDKDVFTAVVDYYRNHQEDVPKELKTVVWETRRSLDNLPAINRAMNQLKTERLIDSFGKEEQKTVTPEINISQAPSSQQNKKTISQSISGAFKNLLRKKSNPDNKKSA